MQTPSSTAKPDKPQISWDVLALTRFYLAWVVLCGHLTWYSEDGTWPFAWDAFGGKAAVSGFLLISGYSIAASLEHNADGFYARRFLRIYPLYFFAIVFAIALDLWTDGHVLAANRNINGLGIGSDLANLFFLQTFLVRPIQFDVPLWSLAIEVFYYILAPLFSRWAPRWLAVLVVASFLCYMLPKHDDWGRIYYAITKLNAWIYLWCWLTGFLIRHRPGKSSNALGLIGIPAMLSGPFTPEPLCLATYMASLGAIVFATEISIRNCLGRIAEYLGDLSYPLYVFHFPALILGWVLGVRAPFLLVLVTIGISVTALHLIDRYLKQQYIKPLFEKCQNYWNSRALPET